MHRQFPGALIMAVVMRRVDATSVADGNRSGWSKVGRVRQDGVGQKEKAAERVLPWTPPRDAEVPNFHLQRSWPLLGEDIYYISALTPPFR